jgi:hypothetical protein
MFRYDFRIMRSPNMPVRTALTAIVLALGAVSAQAADLPTRSRLGAVFAEPAEIGSRADRSGEVTVVEVPWMATSPRIPGYYGRPGSFYYTSYYGTDPGIIFGRLPYACWYYSSC